MIDSHISHSEAVQRESRKPSSLLRVLDKTKTGIAVCVGGMPEEEFQGRRAGPQLLAFGIETERRIASLQSSHAAERHQVFLSEAMGRMAEYGEVVNDDPHNEYLPQHLEYLLSAADYLDQCADAPAEHPRIGNNPGRLNRLLRVSMPHDEDLETAIRLVTGVVPERYGGVRAAVVEAIRNHDRHGNGRDSRHRLVLEAYIERSAFFFKGRDEGPGFNPKLVEPVDEENCTNSGKGIPIMRQFMTSVDFPQDGRRCEMHRDLTV